MKKRLFVVTAIITALCIVLTACAAPAGATAAPAAQENADQGVKAEAAQAAPAAAKEEAKPAAEDGAAKKNIKFYGKIVEYTSGEPTCAKLQELLSDKYDIECLQVDWGNLEQVIRTGIASGEPCDVYNYWPMYLGPFVDEGMCLDLTPYLDADGGAFRNSIDPTSLAIGEFDGKIYGINTTANFSCVIANVDLFKQVGVEVPEGDVWKWDDFLDACAKFKAAGIFPYSNPSDNAKGPWFWGNGLMSLAQDQGKLDAVANGEVSCFDPMFKDALQKTKDLYDNGYCYPGEGAVTLSTDESRAGFAQGKVAMCAEVAAGVGSVIDSLDFECAIIPWPSMGDSNVVTGGGDGLFIPSNVKDPDAAVEVLKAYLSKDVQQINADYGFISSSNEVTSDDPIVSKLNVFKSCMSVREFKSLSAEVQDYCVNQVLSDLVLGDGVDTCLEKMEELRLEAIEQ